MGIFHDNNLHQSVVGNSLIKDQSNLSEEEFRLMQELEEFIRKFFQFCEEFSQSWHFFDNEKNTKKTFTTVDLEPFEWSGKNSYFQSNK